MTTRTSRCPSTAFQNILNSFSDITSLGAPAQGLNEPWYANYAALAAAPKLRTALDGCTGWKRGRYGTLPLPRNVLCTCLVLAVYILLQKHIIKG